MIATIRLVNQSIIFYVKNNVVLIYLEFAYYDAMISQRHYKHRIDLFDMFVNS